MSSVHFYLEKRKDENGLVRTVNVPILVYFSFKGKRLQLNTGERIDFADWDFDEQRVRPEARGARQLNAYLQALAGDILDTYREARTLGMDPGPDYMRGQLRYRRRKENIRFFDVYMRFIDENHDRWSIHTFRKIRTTYNHLARFAAAEEMDIDFSRIDGEFLDRYVRFFRIKYGHSNNTISKNLDVLKWFLNWAAKKGYNKSLLYRDYRFPWTLKPRLAGENLVLDWDELMKLRQIVPGTGALAEVRDIFCFMCFTGLKLSRVNELKPQDVFPEYIRVRGHTDYLNLPVNEHALAIVREYSGRSFPGGRCFPFYSHPVFNGRLKQLGREAGIDRFVTLEVHSGAEKGTRQVRKFEILSSKMAVNTFLFHALRLGISPGVLSFITGSRTMHGVERIRPLLEHVAGEDMRKFDSIAAADGTGVRRDNSR